ncbi:MAG: hypothetical protein ACOC0D_10230 [Spirochaeta sp.]
MNLLELKDIQHVNAHIHYRRVFKANAVLQYLGKKPEERSIHFTIEHSPMGGTSVHIDYLEPIDYPLLPAKQKLKQAIAELDSKGELG